MQRSSSRSSTSVSRAVTKVRPRSARREPDRCSDGANQIWVQHLMDGGQLFATGRKKSRHDTVDSYGFSKTLLVLARHASSAMAR